MAKASKKSESKKSKIPASDRMAKAEEKNKKNGVNPKGRKDGEYITVGKAALASFLKGQCGLTDSVIAEKLKEFQDA